MVFLGAEEQGFGATPPLAEKARPLKACFRPLPLPMRLLSFTRPPELTSFLKVHHPVRRQPTSLPTFSLGTVSSSVSPGVLGEQQGPAREGQVAPAQEFGSMRVTRPDQQDCQCPGWDWRAGFYLWSSHGAVSFDLHTCRVEGLDCQGQTGAL